MRRFGFLVISALSPLLLLQLSFAKSADKAKGPSATLTITTSSSEAREAFEKGMVNYENLHLDRASEEWRKAIKADPNFALGHAWLAFNSTDPSEVIAERQRAKSLLPNVTPGEQLVIKWLVNVQENNFVAGIAAMNDMLALYPKDKRLFFVASNWLMAENENEQASKMCQRALAIDKNYPAALNNLAYADARDANFPVAFAAMERYIKILPNEPNPHDSYGELLRMSGNFEKALEQYRASLKVDPKFYVSQLGLGDTYALMGDQVRARAEYDKAIQEDPDPADKLNFELQKAMTWVRENNFDEADKAFAAVADEAHGKTFDLFEARAHRMMSMYRKSDTDALKHLEAAEAALGHQQEISQADHEEERARILRARAIRAAQSGDNDLSARALAQLESMAKTSRNTVIQQSYHAASGALLVARQKYAEAIADLQEDGDDPFSMNLLARAYDQTGSSGDMHKVQSKLRAVNLPTLEQALVVVPARETRPVR